jgi:hypothetical protein
MIEEDAPCEDCADGNCQLTAHSNFDNDPWMER